MRREWWGRASAAAVVLGLLAIPPAAGQESGQGPVAVIIGGPFSGDPPLDVYLDATTSYTTDPDGWIEAFAWNLGDGTTTTDGYFTHTYEAAGTYTVTLTVTDGTGVTASTTQVIQVGSGSAGSSSAGGTTTGSSTGGGTGGGTTGGSSSGGGAAGGTSVIVAAPVGVGNALTLPAQRHVVRMTPDSGPAIWLLALQQDGVDGNGLSLFRSDDEGQTYYDYAPIQENWTLVRDEADLIPVGDDVAMVYSYEGPTLTGSTSYDVFFQWWRWQAATRDYTPATPVEVYASPSAENAYSRAELAMDSTGVLWVQTFLMGTDGNSSSVEIAYSTDQGSSFTQLPTLDTLPLRGGGRLLWLGTETLLIYAEQGGSVGTWLSLHQDSDPPDAWSTPTQVLPDGIYHGAALSAVATGSGNGMHLVYKQDGDEDLYYAYFDGTSFGPSTLLDDSSDWALQPAITLVNDTLFIFYNHFYPSSEAAYSIDGGWYDFRYVTLSGGTFTSPTILDLQYDWMGYPASAATLPASLTEMPCLFGETPNADVGGNLDEVFVPDGAAATSGGTTAGGTSSGSTTGRATTGESNTGGGTTGSATTGGTSSASSTGSSSGGSVGQGPIAVITGGPFSGNAPLEVYLDATSSYTRSPDGWIEAFSWNLGDGTATTDSYFTHTYESDGTYTVVLTATAGDGTTSTATQTIVVGGGASGNGTSGGTTGGSSSGGTTGGARTGGTSTGGEAGQGPVAVITGGPFAGTAPLAVYLDATSSYTQSSSGWIQAFSWSFGDGTTSSDAYLIHTFEAAGTYTVKLTATAGDGTTSVATQTVTVE